MASRVGLQIAPSAPAVRRSLPTAPAAPAAALATANAPPLILPGEHFAAAFTFFLTGIVGLGLVAPNLARGIYMLPHVIAVVHLFTLGFVSMSIFGALYQFLPVAVGEAIRSERLAHATFAIYVTGVPTLVVGLALHLPLVRWGAVLVALAFALFAANLALTLVRAKSRDLTYWALSGAAFFLVVTLSFGLLLAFNLTGRFFAPEARVDVLVAHVHVALVGWVMLVMVGVGNRLLPMFMLSHGHRETYSQLAVPSLFAGCLLLTLSTLLAVAALRIVGFSLVALGVLLFLAQAVEFYRHRKKGKLDPGMRLAVTGLFGLLVALVLGPIAWASGGSLSLVTAYVFVLLVGSISLFICGYYFKIVPFIVWNQRFRDLIGRRKVPGVAELYSAKVATAVLVALFVGVVVTALAILVASPTLVHVGVTSLLVGALLEAQQLIRVARTKVPT